MRMPMGVPVVRPSKTPDRIFTTSPSLRWLTNCEVPVRRRSTSGWMSSSESARPGGHPSTMQPSAGPWLSPNVVTVNNLPIELPDIFFCLGQLLTRQQKHASSAALEIEPGERHAWIRAPERALRIPDLDHQHAARSQVPCRV